MTFANFTRNFTRVFANQGEATRTNDTLTCCICAYYKILTKPHETAPQVPSAPQEEAEMLLLLLYTNNYQHTINYGFLTGSYPTFPVTTLNLCRRNSKRRAKHCHTFAVKNFNPISSVKKQVIKWVCQTLTHPLYLIMVIGFIPLPLYST